MKQSTRLAKFVIRHYSVPYAYVGGDAALTILSSKDFFPSETYPFFIQKYTIRPGEVVPTHAHEFFELVFVESGSAEHVMDQISYELHTGDVFVIEPSVYHEYTASDSQETTVYNVLFHLDFIRSDLQSLLEVSSFVHLFYLTPFLRHTSNFVPYLSLSVEELTLLTQYLDLLLRESREQESGYELASKTLLINTLIFLSRCCEKQPKIAEAIQKPDPTMEMILAFIRDNYQHPLNVKHISTSFGMSVTSLTTKFKQHTGMTVLEYKHQMQINEACHRLTNTDDTILNIAHTVGFDDLSFFYRVFRRMKGMTPAHYRAAR